ncbi:MAG TPA: aminotransferase class V-fold PLP-dependent enzyme [Chloroflexota bacterium]|nr:aminotransferase class V-fold PLP-dependent enzyme [Chloroflexota bacterium]
MLLAGGGPATPDPRVLLALTTPIIGQFDPAFTALMDDVMTLARQTFLTSNARCLAVSGLASAGVEALLNSLVEDGDRVAIGGGPRFVAQTAVIARRCGATVTSLDEIGADRTFVKLLVVPLIDLELGQLWPVANLATAAHVSGAKLLVDATLGLGAVEYRNDDWHIDACVAGADYAVGAPSGMTLVTYSADIEALLHARQTPPRTSYLDLLQLQAYWSPERLNHHTAPTSLIYGLREALRYLVADDLTESWHRHRQTGSELRKGLTALGLEVSGQGPYAIVHLATDVAEPELRRRLREDYAIDVHLVAPRTWRIGLLGADAQPANVRRILMSIEKLLHHE